MNYNELIKFDTLAIMHNIYNKMAPEEIIKYFIFSNYSKNFILSHHSNLHKSLYNNSCHIWNTVPNNLKSEKTFKNIKNELSLYTAPHVQIA